MLRFFFKYNEVNCSCHRRESMPCCGLLLPSWMWQKKTWGPLPDCLDSQPCSPSFCSVASDKLHTLCNYVFSSVSAGISGSYQLGLGRGLHPWPTASPLVTVSYYHYNLAFGAILPTKSRLFVVTSGPLNLQLSPHIILLQDNLRAGSI